MATTKTATALPLVSTEWLANHLQDSGIRIIEINNTPALYEEGHIPGAVSWNWKANLWHETDREFPTAKEMAERLGRIGVTERTTVVLYGIPVQFGTYAFWVLTMCGHPDVRVLDGSRVRWVGEGRPLTKDVPAVQPAPYSAQEGDRFVRVGRDEIRSKLHRLGLVLLDVRSPEEYRGERVMPYGSDPDHGAERKGRIPGAVHIHYTEFFNQDQSLKSPSEIRALLEKAGIVPEKAEEIVTYCRLSHRATFAWFALRYLLGLKNTRVYDGSWTEWGSIVGFPIER